MAWLSTMSTYFKRDSSRLLVLDKNTGEVCHKHFYDVIDYLNEGDALVLNDTKVIPARLIGTKVDTNAVIEVLMLRNIEDDIWELRPGDNRVFYFFYDEDGKFVLLHHFKKKTQKTPKREIERAKAERDDYKARKEAEKK